MTRLEFGAHLPALALLCGLLTNTAGASAQESPPSAEGWSVRFYAASIDFDSSGTHHDALCHECDLDIGFGLGLNAEYRFSRRFGLDIGVLGGAALDVAWTPVDDGEWIWTAYDTLAFTPLTAGVDIHLVPDNDVDVYVRPMLTWTHYGGIVVHSGPSWASTEVQFDEDFSVAVALGLGVPIGDRRRWSFAASLTHFENDLDSRSRLASQFAGNYDATVFGVGFGYRF